MICLYFSKLVTCQLTKTLLKYAIICSMKIFMTISRKCRVVICLGSCLQTFYAFKIALMKCFPCWTLLQLLTYAWLKVSRSKVCGDKYQMMSEIMGLGDFGQIVLSMVIFPIVTSMTSLEFGIPKNPKNFQALIVNNNQCFKKLRFRVFRLFPKCKKGCPQPKT